MLFQRVHCEGARRVGGTGQHVVFAADLDDVRRVPAPCALGMEGVDRAALHGTDCVFDKAGFVERVRVDHHLHVHRVSNREAAVDGTRRGTPILMQFERTGTGFDLLL